MVLRGIGKLSLLAFCLFCSYMLSIHLSYWYSSFRSKNTYMVKCW